MKKILVVVIVGFTSLWAVVPAAVSADVPQGFGLTLSVAASSSAGLRLTAQIAAPTGTSIADQKIAFELKATLVGKEGFEEIGTATTNLKGAATVSYVPRSVGEVEFVAIWNVAGLDSPVVGTATTTVANAVSGTQSLKSQPLREIGSNLVTGLLILVAIVWLVLLVTLARAFFGIPRVVRREKSSETVRIVAEVRE